jgi:hypothetical protein
MGTRETVRRHRPLVVTASLTAAAGTGGTLVSVGLAAAVELPAAVWLGWVAVHRFGTRRRLAPERAGPR